MNSVPFIINIVREALFPIHHETNRQGMAQERHKTQNHETTKSQTPPVHHLTGINTKVMEELDPVQLRLEYYQMTAMQHDAIQDSWSNASEFKTLTVRAQTSICFSN
jgi:hypothetical protein